MIRELVQSGFRLSGTRDPRLLRGLAWTAIEGLLAALPYPLLYWLLRDVFQHRATQGSIAGLAVAMAASVALRIMAGRIGLPLIFAGAYAMMGQARLRVADHLRHLPMGWFNRQRSGELAARLTADLDLVESLWSHFLGLFVSSLATPAVLLAFLFWVDARLALLALLGLPLAIAALAWTQHAASRGHAGLSQASAATQSALLEYVQGIATIRSFGRQGQAWRALQALLARHHDAMLRAEIRPAPWLAAYGFMLEIGYASLMLAGIWQLSKGTLAPETLLVFLILALPLYRCLFDVGLSTMLLRIAKQALGRIDTLLAQSPLPEPARPRLPHGHDIEFDRVCFSYEPGSRVLRNVSCRIPANTLTAVVGPSGAGKSTLVHLIARLWDVDSGSVRLGGADLRDIGSARVNDRVAMVFQDVVVFSGSVLDNLRIGRPGAALAEVVDAAKRARAHDFIMQLPQGYDTPLEEHGASLSGGERQRLSIARALLKDAPILLLDEATANIDPSASADIQQALAEAARGRTVVAIAHRLRSICGADQILVLDVGRLVEQGRHDELIAAQGVYARLWARQEAGREAALMSPIA